MKIQKNCLVCTTSFITYKYRNDEGKKTCSKKCRSIYMSQQLKNARKNMSNEKKLSWYKKISNIRKQRIAEGKIIVTCGFKKGELNPAWTGGEYTRRKKLYIGDTLEKVCPICGNIFSTEVNWFFCSKKCYQKSGKAISYPQAELFKRVQKIHPDAFINEQMYFENGKYCFPDITIHSEKVILEYDGSHVHNFEHDRIRDRKILNAEYWIIHYIDYIPTEEEIKENIEEVKYERISGVLYITGENKRINLIPEKLGISMTHTVYGITTTTYY